MRIPLPAVVSGPAERALPEAQALVDGRDDEMIVSGDEDVFPLERTLPEELAS